MKIEFSLNRNQIVSLVGSHTLSKQGMIAVLDACKFRFDLIGYSALYSENAERDDHGNCTNPESLDAYKYPLVLVFDGTREEIQTIAKSLDAKRKGSGMYMMRGWKVTGITDDNRIVPWHQSVTDWLKSASLNDIKVYLKKVAVAPNSIHHEIIVEKAKAAVPELLIRDVNMGKSEKLLGAAWTSQELAAHKFWKELQVG